MSNHRTVKSLADLHALIPGASPPEEKPRAGKNPVHALVTLHVLFEKAGRKGSGVTLVRGFHHTSEDLLRYARDLKALCGAGGTVKHSEIEIQGDHRPKVASYFKQQGFTVKIRT